MRFLNNGIMVLGKSKWYILGLISIFFCRDTYGAIPMSVIIPPVIVGCPTDKSTENLPDSCGARVFWVPPITSGILVSTHNTGDTFPVGTTTVVYTAYDPLNPNDSSTCSFTVTVSDIELPVLANCPSNLTLSSGGNCDQVASWTPPTAMDNCSAVVSSSHDPGATFPVGTTTVTYTVTDPSGNNVSCSFEVAIVDDTNPAITNCSPLVTVTDYQPGSNDAVASWTEPIATDNCGISSLNRSHNPGDRFPEGTTEVTYSATDINGNTSSCSFEVTVVGPPNNPPAVIPQIIDVRGGETVTICIQASDPEGHSMELKVVNNLGSGTISKVNSPGLCFDYTAPKEFEGREIIDLSICDTGDPQACSQSSMEVIVTGVWDLDISQIITPNGDAINDTWFIGNIDKYPNNRVRIFDRWGNLIYKAANYNNSSTCWHGENSDGQHARGGQVPSGTYYYQLDLENGASFKGYLELVRP